MAKYRMNLSMRNNTSEEIRLSTLRKLMKELRVRRVISFPIAMMNLFKILQTLLMTKKNFN
jgi:hypothetical protein